MSIEYYDRNSARFFAGSVDADMSETRSRFLRHVRDGGGILDVGCGSGRDSRAFAEGGYAVTAIDGSSEMVRLATAHCGVAVRLMRFQEIGWKDVFHGIWACASLLHVPRAELLDVVARLAAALKSGGTLYMSFKLGEEERWQSDRHFTDMTEPRLSALAEGAGLVVEELWQNFDARPERKSDRWVSVIARRR